MQENKNITIGAIIAMESEAEILISEMEISNTVSIANKKVYVGKAFGKNLVLVICGVGKVNAALGAQLAISNFNVDKLLNFGVAGGLNDGTKLCNVYQIGQAVQFDFDLTQLNGTKMGTLDEYQENYLSLNLLELAYPIKKLGTSDRFNDSPIDYQLLTEELQADIRDMEGGAIVQVALANDLPIHSFKAISDVAGSGSTTEQFLQNKAKALENLKKEFPFIFEKL